MIHFLGNAVAVLLLVAAGLALLVWAIDRIICLIGMSGMVYALIRESCRTVHSPWWVSYIESTSGVARSRIFER